MAQLLLLCLILANAHVGLALANEKAHHHHQTMAHSGSEPFSNPPAPTPSKAEPPMIRKLAKHQNEVAKSSDSPSPSPNKENASKAEENGLAMIEHNVGVQIQNVHLSNKHHRSMDRSVAGGGVILGGLATTFLVAVFCYIRATGRHKNETSSAGL
ncbi:hypothetical protein L484_016948 [Morus notabilis]|uniref:Uncharacterized protein n=1 Tax=Morus notabilis TaxID=981085 RepID=W9QQS8_9ROSA|nr:hypothetical protein L484_016948 [Morus notabilis]